MAHKLIKSQIQLSKDNRYISDLSKINVDLLFIVILNKDAIGEDYFILLDLRDTKSSKN